MHLENPDVVEEDFEIIQEVLLKMVSSGDGLSRMGEHGARMVLHTEYFAEIWKGLSC